MSKQTLHLCVLLCAAVCTPALHAQAPVPDSPAIEQKVDAMLSKLTLEQKIDLIGGEDSMYIRAEPGFPRLKMSDGPDGVRTWGPDTAYAGGIALAASWDPALAQRMGVAIGQDARARAVHFLLGPGVNIYRAPMNGRNFEYFGEDPFLAARTVVGYINGLQSQGVIATVKHFALNNQEWDRHNVSSDADPRTIRELYFPAFEAAVREAHVGSVMNSYNLINGIHATQNNWLNNEVLKKEWGFDGILMSDWDATYDGPAAANGGLDLEMPSGKFMNRASLLPAIKNGTVSTATIDDKVRRIFRTALRFGFLDRPQEDLSIPFYNPEGKQVALDQARESITLLKNENSLLPLDPHQIHTLAVIGPDAWPAVAGAGGSSTVEAYAPVSLLAGLSNYAPGQIKVLYARGLPTTDDIFSHTTYSKQPGEAASQPDDHIKVQTFDTKNFTGKSTTRFTGALNSWRSEEWMPPAREQHSYRYSAIYTPEKSGSYLFLIAADGNDTYKLTLDGKPALEETGHEGQYPHSLELPLSAGKPTTIQIDYAPASANVRLGFGIRAVDDLVSPQAKKIAASADAVVVSAGFDASTESEGFDRTYGLPWGQDQLIQSIASANPHAIVTVTAGGDVDTRPWLDKIPAFLQLWYPGQEGGTALAEILFGARAPEGHLPISYEHSWEENPTHDSYYAPSTPGGEVPHVKYSEGLYVGYRYYTSEHKKPLFPFGYGLSYTTFSFTNLKLAADSIPSGSSTSVTFDVTNTGSKAGAAVAQLYVGDPSAKVKRPVKELKGFEKVRLDPGATRHVTLTLDPRAFSYWDEPTHNWKIDPGQFTVMVGDSADNTPLTANLTIQ